MKKILFFVCTLLCANVLLAQVGTTFWIDNLQYEVISTNPAEVEVNDANSSITTANIPETVSYEGINYRVTSIGDRAFRLYGNLTSVNIPNSVTSIGDLAFEYCSRLTSVDIPNSVTSIGGSAFAYCRRLTSVNIGNGVTSIGTCAFRDCSSLTSVNIGNGVTSIGDGAFEYCSSLTSITIHNSVTSIGEDAFKGCDNLTSVTCLAETAPSLGSEVFSSTPSTKVLNIPCGSDYSSWESATDWASVGCTLDLGNGLTSFPLTFAIISEEERTMKVSACDASATVVDIPASVMYNGKVYNVTSIGNSAFSAHFNLTSVTIPNSVISIDDYAFYYCNSLTFVSIGNSVASIGDRAFSYCSGLTSVNIPNSVITIGYEAFRNCSSLTSVTLPITSIGYAAFEDCTSLTSVTIPNSVTSIGNRAFYNCVNLTSVTIPNSITSLGAQVFAGCVNLTSVTIPNSVTSIGASAFYNCSGLTSVTIPNSVTSIGNYAFSNCSALTSDTCLAETSPWLGVNVFYNTPSNATLTVPFNASGYTSDWGNATWQKIYHKINKEETKTLTNAFEITEANKRQIINEGVLRIKQGGQLINQTATNVEGIIEIEAINRANNWNYIGAPFANNYQLGAILPQANDVSVSIFNHSTGSWSSEWATYDDVINTGESFAAWNWGASPITFTTYGDIWNYETNQAGKYNFEQDPTYTLNNQDEITISHQDNNSEDNVNWLSVANPYTFKLDIAQIRTDNELQGDVLYTYNGATFQPVETGEIAVTEGFFVNNTTLKFKKGQRKTNIAKSTKQKDYIKLIMTDTDTQAELLFAQNENANANYDRFDANKLFSPKEITEPYFVTDGNALVKEEVKELPYTATLNIKSYENKDITIKITNIPEGVNVYLLDNDQDTKMNGDVEYTTNITAGENADRFKILFKPQQKLETKQNNHITINNHNRHITITSTITDLHIEVYNTLGQKVHTTKDYTFTLDYLPSGSYLIKAFKGRQTKTEKIVIE